MHSGEFTKEFEKAKNNNIELPEYALFIAGAARQASCLSIEVILQFLQRLYIRAEQGFLSESSLLSIEQAVYQGKLGTANKIFNDSVTRNYAHCSQQINHKAFSIQGCSHLYHKECLKTIVNTYIQRAQTEISCGIRDCPGRINESVIRLIDEALYLELQNIELHMLIASGTLGQLISCPLCREKFIVEGSQKVKCFYCQITICSCCNRIAASCACNK